MSVDKSIDSLELEAEAARLRFRHLLGRAAESVSPSNLRRDLGEGASRAAAMAAQSATAKLNTPAGLMLAGAGLVAILLSAKTGHARRIDGDAETVRGIDPAIAKAPGQPEKRNSGGSRGSHPSMLVTMAAAVGAGMALDRLVPLSAYEKSTLDNIRTEIHKFASDWVSSRIRSALVPGPGASGGALGLLLGAVGVAAAMTKHGGPAGR